MNRILIILASIAVFLAAVTYFTVFYSGGTYVIPSKIAPSNATTTLVLPTTTASSTVTSTASTTDNSTVSGDSGSGQPYATDYASPPLSWNEGGEMMLITGASYDGSSELTLKLTIVMGDAMECVPMNLRLVADESGTLTPPDTSSFIFPETHTCTGAPGATYSNEGVTFSVKPSAFPLLLTTGGSSNAFFEVSTTTFGGIDIEIPAQSG